MIMTVELALPLRQQLRCEALDAYPRECCGLLEGFAGGELLRVVALHRMPNIAKEPDRFDIDPAAHIGLLRTLRGSGRHVVGCYHSHPNGRAEPSEDDRQSAIDANFLWLICAVEAEARATRIGAYLSTVGCFSPVALVPTSAAADVCSPIRAEVRAPR